MITAGTSGITLAGGKQTNFDVATRVPMMVRVPGVTDAGIVSDNLVEMVDIFPTLVDAAGLAGLPQCASTASPDLTCTEGSSMVPLMTEGDSAEWKDAAFSQMRFGSAGMGYSIRTSRFRYTEIIGQTEGEYDWDDVRGHELYDYTNDPEGNVNLAGKAGVVNLQAMLAEKLRAGWTAATPGVSKRATSGGAETRLNNPLKELLLRELIQELENN